MFIYSMRASTIKFFGVICIALVGLIALIAVVPSYISSNGTVEVGISDLEGKSYNYDKMKNEYDECKRNLEKATQEVSSNES